MRSAFVNALTEIARAKKQVVLLTPDMGFSVFEKYREEFPERFFNTGIAEQNTVGMASGLALTGKTVYVYSITPFVTMRPFEQVRIDVCYQNLPVKLVGSGGGLVYGALGPTHHTIEDIAIMRALPNMTVLCPGDPVETYACTKLSNDIKGPVYMRLGKNNEPVIHDKVEPNEMINGLQVRKGDDAVILTTGNTLHSAVLASEQLQSRKIDCGVTSIPVIKPLNEKLIQKIIGKGIPIFTLEEHSVMGGFGGAVAEVIAESGIKTRFKRIGLTDKFCSEVGDHVYLREKCGIDVKSIVRIIESRV